MIYEKCCGEQVTISKGGRLNLSSEEGVRNNLRHPKQFPVRVLNIFPGFIQADPFRSD